MDVDFLTALCGFLDQLFVCELCYSVCAATCQSPLC